MLRPEVQPALHHVVIAPYDPTWPARANEESARLIEALGANVRRVEHIGSTSVPGLAAKPVIDLMPLVTSIEDLERDRTRIESLGYAWHGEFGIEGRRYCTVTNSAGVRLINLHAFQEDSPHVLRHLAFRNYLRAHPDVAREYENEKRRAASLHPNDSRAYNDEKFSWVARAEALALEWHFVEGTRGAASLPRCGAAPNISSRVSAR
jgi:GrpB-like predicted nucleotidyltransferase (UPF0157 family)